VVEGILKSRYFVFVSAACSNVCVGWYYKVSKQLKLLHVARTLYLGCD